MVFEDANAELVLADPRLVSRVLARVDAAAGSAEKADFARQCGADEVVTYSQPSWGDPVDLVLDAAPSYGTCSPPAG